jgi:hypothetical protein
MSEGLGSNSLGFSCYSCGKQHEGLFVTRGDTCAGCSRDLRVCKNCRHYSTKHYNECAETIAERIVDKEKANFCDLFSPNKGAGGATREPTREELWAKAAALFQKPKGDS